MTRTVIVLMAAGTFLLSGCTEDPCKDMERQAPPEATALMEKGYEVSYPVTDDLECELQPTGRWIEDA